MTAETTDTTKTRVSLDKLAELDGGGSRLAVHGAPVAVGTDEGRYAPARSTPRGDVQPP